MRHLPIIVTAIAATLVVSADAEAQNRYGRRHNGDGIVGYVHAESRYGSATVSGPVRHNTAGRLEVRMPGGTWIECGRSCRDTLRRETVDFWQSRDTPRSPYVDGPGYFTFRR